MPDEKPVEIPEWQKAAMILRLLREREAWWRERVGDEDYERSVAHWESASREPR